MIRAKRVLLRNLGKTPYGSGSSGPASRHTDATAPSAKTAKRCSWPRFRHDGGLFKGVYKGNYKGSKRLL